MSKEITIIRSKISIPSTPNFIIENGVPKGIGFYTPEALKEIAKEWTKNLLEKAEKSFKRLNG